MSMLNEKMEDERMRETRNGLEKRKKMVRLVDNEKLHSH